MDEAREVTSLEFLLDEAAEARIREEWQVLAGAGVSSLGAHSSPSNRPHVTVVVWETDGAGEGAHLPGDVPLELGLPLPIELGGLLLFGSGARRVLARAVVPSVALLRAHAALFASAGSAAILEQTRPGAWTPHLTLARRIRLDDLPRVLPLLDAPPPNPAAAPASIAGLRRWDAATATVTRLR